MDNNKYTLIISGAQIKMQPKENKIIELNKPKEDYTTFTYTLAKNSRIITPENKDEHPLNSLPLAEQAMFVQMAAQVYLKLNEAYEANKQKVIKKYGNKFNKSSNR